MLRKGKNSEKKKKWEEWIQPILASIPFFFSWKKVPMKVILRPWSWGPLRGLCASQGLTVGMLAQLPPPARVTSYCQSRLAVGTG